MIDHMLPRDLDDIYGPGAENADDGIDDQEMTVKITPKRECKACRGGGTVDMGSVPYGSTWVSMGDGYCDCVLDQLPEDGDHLFIELQFAPELLAAWAAESKAEEEFFSRLDDEDTQEATSGY